MAFNLKKSNTLNTSIDDLSSVFEFFDKKISESWIDKDVSIKNAEIIQKEFDESPNIDIVVDALKNRSLVTYIDAPWGSGKTRFVEGYTKWLIQKDSKKEVKIIDAWEVYSGSNINDILWTLFKPDEKKLSEIFKSINDSKNISNETKIRKHAKRFLFLAELATTGMPFVNKVVDAAKKINISNNNDNKIGLDNYDVIQNKKMLLADKLLEAIETSNDLKKRKMVIIDNIERLDSKNRLDVVNKIINWANISGVTYVFLTNFEKIKIDEEHEENFWSKISLQETFKLTNDWEIYLKNYEYKINVNKQFMMSNYSKLLSFITKIIPTFFTNNKDNMDIREIKKLLDNWEGKRTFENERELVTSFFKYLIEDNLSGLDKYFVINRAISMLTDDAEYWELWSGEYEEIFEKYSDTDIDETPIFNNKLLRIQSNFFGLEMEHHDDVIKLKNPSLDLLTEDEAEFKEFNNFIDETANSSFKKILLDIFKTREIVNEKKNNYLYILLTETNYCKYFEFKYNNLKKIYLYNIMLGN